MLYQIWKRDIDPTNATSPYTPYTFPNVLPTHEMGIARRESITVIPGMNGVLDGYGQRSGPLDKRYLTVGFRVMTKRGADAAHDLLMAAMLGGDTVRLVRKTEAGTLLFTTATLVNTQEPRTSDEEIYFDFKVTWRIRPDWRTQFSQASDIWGINDGVWGTSDGTWGSTFAVALPSSPTTVLVGNTGTAGLDLPTLDDTGPIITLTGPWGGDGGSALQNFNAPIKDTHGATQYTTITIPTKLLAGQSATLDCGAQRFIVNGVAIRPGKAGVYQRDWFRIVAGVVNQLSATCTGANAVGGGSIVVDWYKKFA